MTFQIMCFISDTSVEAFCGQFICFSGGQIIAYYKDASNWVKSFGAVVENLDIAHLCALQPFEDLVTPNVFDRARANNEQWPILPV